MMSGQRKLRLHELKSTEPAIKPSTSRAKAKASSRSQKSGNATAAHISSTYPSTIVTSPVSGPDRWRNKVADEDSDDAFEPPLRGRLSHRTNATTQLGPPITTDSRMDALNQSHQVIVHQFVDAAKILEEKIRNQKGLRRPLFTEAHLRDMAINWTLTTEEMCQISGINVEHAVNLGSRLVPLLRDYLQKYEALIEGEKQDRDMDANHKIVDIVEVSDDDGDDGDYEDPIDPQDDMDDALVVPSKYFSSRQKGPSAAEVAHFNQVMSVASADPPHASRASPTPGRRSYGGGNSWGKGKPNGGKRNRPRKGSASLPGRSAPGSSSAGVTKRKSTGSGYNASKKPSTTSSSKGSRSIMSQFAHGSGSGKGGGGMSGIQPMPT